MKPEKRAVGAVFAALGKAAARSMEPLATKANPNAAVIFKIFILNPFFVNIPV